VDVLRVAVVTESFLPSVNGVTNSVVQITSELARRGHQCLIVAPGPGPDRFESIPVLRIRGLDLPKTADLRVAAISPRLTRALEAFGPDVVHAAAPVALGAAGLRSARGLGVPSVAVYQTDLAGFAARHGLGAASGMIWRWMSRVHQRASLTLAPSSAAVEDLRRLGVERIRRWARGVDIERFNQRHRCHQLRSSLAPRGEVVVGYVGRLCREKQVHLLAPLASLHGVRVVIVGDGSERARLQHMLPTAIFTGMLGGAELSRYMASLDIFVHAGVNETFCQAIQEAMAAGVAVVAPAAGGPLDLVQHGTTGLLWHHDSPDSLVEAVRELVADEDRRTAMGHAARRAVSWRTWPLMVDELVGHYADAACRTTPLAAA